MKKILILLCAISLLFVACFATACGEKKPTVNIYTSTEQYNMEYLQACLNKQFPDYNVVISYMSTGDIAAKVQNEGELSDADIIYTEEYAYLQTLIAAGVVDSIAGDYDMTKYTDESVPASMKDYVLPSMKQGGCIVVNTKVLEEKGIEKPTSYRDLLDPKYKNLVCMPSPVSSGTGYMFYYSLVNAEGWGEDEALDYFWNLKKSKNMVEFSKSGSTPMNKLVQKEVAVGFCMICTAVEKINAGNRDLEILFFDEGAPFNLYGNIFVKGKKARPEVREVMDYLESFYTNEASKLFYPEQILKDTDYTIENHPTDIAYADMDGVIDPEKKADLLAKWNEMLAK
ncbi:MAG: extracellular solute-binding protein [Clostridia bacterium]|nr:extracellular solute-binding protein [Clostridia bacterium]